MRWLAGWDVGEMKATVSEQAMSREKWVNFLIPRETKKNRTRLSHVFAKILKALCNFAILIKTVSIFDEDG